MDHAEGMVFAWWAVLNWMTDEGKKGARYKGLCVIARKIYG